MSRPLLLSLVLASLTTTACVPLAATPREIGRQTLPAGDGFGSLGEGVSGGAAAADAYVFHVRTRAELVAALAAAPAGAPRIVYVHGVVDANVDDGNRPLSCEAYQRESYTRDAFLAFYNPAGPWGPNAPANTPGSLEAARRASAAAQAARVRIRVPDNTTLIGADAAATLRGAWLDVRGTPAEKRRNVIVRHLTFEDTFDCFPAWTPTRTADGTWAGTGAWDSEYDAISLRDAEQVWIDHNEFRDRGTADRTLPTFFNALFQMHDGLLDITNASDRVTVSWNRFFDHDKVMLIGSSDSATADMGRLRVTLHHNHFENVGQRAPRVRYGQVHVYNNYYVIPDETVHSYSWGVGFQPLPLESGIYAENNFFRTEPRVRPDHFIAAFAGGRSLFVAGTMLTAVQDDQAVDPWAAYNAARDPDLAREVGWTPRLTLEFDPTHRVPAIVELHAGPHR